MSWQSLGEQKNLVDSVARVHQKKDTDILFVVDQKPEAAAGRKLRLFVFSAVTFLLRENLSRGPSIAGVI